MNASADYVARVNRAIDHILSQLDQPIRLEKIAEVAHFSPFHFHRIFKSLTGETLSQFVKRVRLDRALFMMSHQKEHSLTRVALACGFASSSDFSRSFKQRFGVPPSAFDLDTYRETRRKELEVVADDPKDSLFLSRLPSGENPDSFEVVMRPLPPRRVAYLRVFDPFRPKVVTDAAARLVEWAEEEGYADNAWLGYMWEDPDIVPLADCRYDVAVVAPDFVASEDIGCLDFPAMTVAEVEIRGDIELEQRAIDWLYLTWLANSRYVPDHQPCFESWIGRPFEHGFEHFELKVQLPVKIG